MLTPLKFFYISNYSLTAALVTLNGYQSLCKTEQVHCLTAVPYQMEEW